MIIEQLVGKTFTNVFSRGDELIFEGPEGRGVFFHSQDCCESVYIDEIVGDLHDLEYAPILVAEERTGDTPPGVDEPGESYTWTFYTFRTIYGSVDVRWLGTSNGYYSESVYFEWSPR